MNPALVLPDGHVSHPVEEVGRREYMIVAKKPFGSEMKTIPSCGKHPTAEAALMAIKGRLMGDPQFQKRWKNCSFYPVDITMALHTWDYQGWRLGR